MNNPNDWQYLRQIFDTYQTQVETVERLRDELLGAEQRCAATHERVVSMLLTVNTTVGELATRARHPDTPVVSGERQIRLSDEQTG